LEGGVKVFRVFFIFFHGGNSLNLVVLLWAEFEWAESFWAEYTKGPKTIGPKMAKTSSSGPPLARAHFGPLELVSAILFEIICHSLLHSSGHKLRLAEALIFTILIVKLIFLFCQLVKYFIFLNC
jgi:hypothetical protein